MQSGGKHVEVVNESGKLGGICCRLELQAMTFTTKGFKASELLGDSNQTTQKTDFHIATFGR